MHFNGQNRKKCRKQTLIIFWFYMKICPPTFFRGPLGWESDIISKNSQGKKLWHISKFSYRSYKIFGMVGTLVTKKSPRSAWGTVWWGTYERNFIWRRRRQALSRLLRPLPKQVREYSRYCYFRPAGVLPEVLYQTSGSTPQEYSQCKILRGLGVLPEVLYQTCGSTPTKMVREGSGSTPRPLKIIHWECSWLDI